MGFTRRLTREAEQGAVGGGGGGGGGGMSRWVGGWEKGRGERLSQQGIVSLTVIVHLGSCPVFHQQRCPHLRRYPGTFSAFLRHTTGMFRILAGREACGRKEVLKDGR